MASGAAETDMPAPEDGVPEGLEWDYETRPVGDEIVVGVQLFTVVGHAGGFVIAVDKKKRVIVRRAAPIKAFPARYAVHNRVKSWKASPKMGARLSDLVDQYALSRDPFFHPFSDSIVVDHLHPSLSAVPVPAEAQPSGRFERTDKEGLSWMWPGSRIEITRKDGSISGARWDGQTMLDRSPQGLALEKALEEPLSELVRNLTSTLEYVGRELPLDGGDAEEGFDKDPDIIEIGSQMVVFPKIADYVLLPGQTYTGVWHFEGIPVENIIATGIYFPRVDEGMEGGVIDFVEPLTYREAWEDWDRGQLEEYGSPEEIAHLRGGWSSLKPLVTKQNVMAVWPNSAVHRLLHLHNPTSKPLTRRIIVFFFVEPGTEEHIPLADESLRLDPEEAAKRVNLVMAERSALKELINGRETHRCEH